MDQDNAIGIAFNAGFQIFIDEGLAEVQVNYASNVVISDCIVAGVFQQGVQINGCQKTTIKQTQITGDGAIGISLAHAFDVEIADSGIDLEFASTGITMQNSEAVDIENTTITLESPLVEANGIDMLNTIHTVIKNCIITLTVPETSSPGGDGIVMLGGVKGCVIQDCAIDNYPEVGILSLNPIDFGPSYEIIIDHCVIHNALEDAIQFNGVLGSTIQNCDIAFADFNGINLIDSTNITVLGNIIQSNGQEGIILDGTTTNCAVRDNTVLANLLKGVDNMGGASNAIYHNFAQANGASPVDNYTGVALVVAPAPGIGVLENISQ